MQSRILDLSLEGGWPALDFVNTVNYWTDARPQVNYLESYGDLLALVERLEMIEKNELDQLLAFANTEAGERTLAKALVVRETLYRLFASWENNKTIPAEVLADFNGHLSEAYKHVQLELVDGSVRRRLAGAPTQPELPLWAVLLSAETLLLSDKLDRVKSCPNCGWLFLDSSKNASRRWCNMQTCGSADKARRYYHRKKK